MVNVRRNPQDYSIPRPSKWEHFQNILQDTKKFHFEKSQGPIIHRQNEHLFCHPLKPNPITNSLLKASKSASFDKSQCGRIRWISPPRGQIGGSCLSKFGTVTSWARIILGWGLYLWANRVSSGFHQVAIRRKVLKVKWQVEIMLKLNRKRSHFSLTATTCGTEFKKRLHVLHLKPPFWRALSCGTIQSGNEEVHEEDWVGCSWLVKLAAFLACLEPEKNKDIRKVGEHAMTSHVSFEQEERARKLNLPSKWLSICSAEFNFKEQVEQNKRSSEIACVWGFWTNWTSGKKIVWTLKMYGIMGQNRLHLFPTQHTFKLVRIPFLKERRKICWYCWQTSILQPKILIRQFSTFLIKLS